MSKYNVIRILNGPVFFILIIKYDGLKNMKVFIIFVSSVSIECI